MLVFSFAIFLLYQYGSSWFTSDVSTLGITDYVTQDPFVMKEQGKKHKMISSNNFVQMNMFSETTWFLVLLIKVDDKW